MSDRWPSPQFPEPWKPSTTLARKVEELFQEERTRGQRAADWVATFVGSWWFIIVQTLIIVAWVLLNTTALLKHWDPYPFIFMNLIFSLESAFASPMILMSQNREAERDRLMAQHDYMLTMKAEAEVRAVLAHLAAQDKALEQMHAMLLAVMKQRAAEGQNGQNENGSTAAPQGDGGKDVTP